MINEVDYKLDKLAELYSTDKISVQQLEELAIQALNSRTPMINGMPIMPDPALINIINC